MKAIVFFTLALLGVMQAQAAELTTFQAGDPIYASELNGNFQELEARINALTALLESSGGDAVGEHFNIFLPGNSAPVLLESGYDYFITDAIWPLFVRALSSCSSSSSSNSNVSIVGSEVTQILEVPGRGSGGTCGVIGDSISLKTPVKVSGGLTIASQNTLNAGIRIIGYKVPVVAP